MLAEFDVIDLFVAETQLQVGLTLNKAYSVANQ